MIKNLSAFAGIIVLIVATPAAADWQWTRWGMSLADAKAAGGDRVVEYNGGPGWNLHTDKPYTVGSFTFDEVRFRFIDDKLVVVSLKASATDFDDIEEAVSGGVGRPVSAEYGRYPERIWVDRERGNTITLQTYGDIAVLDYKPTESGF